MTLLPDWFQSENCWLICGILVDPGLDLGGPEDRRVRREPVDPRVAVVRRVHARGDPGDHVRAVGRDHRLEEQELDAASSPGRRIST